MAGDYGYDKLSVIKESQDIAEYIDTTWRAHESGGANGSQSTLLQLSPAPSPTSLFPAKRIDTLDHASLNTDSSSSSGIGKLKDSWEKGISRIRRKPLPRYLQGSIRRHPAADIKPARIGRGVWKDQQLVDRSLRFMAFLMTLFTIAMIVIICTHAKAFGSRVNKFTSSIGGKVMDCNDVTHTNTVLLLLINVAATMILGMSNTYQQLVTSLKISDLRPMLERFGDSRVGTNSPFNINHKSEGKRKSWAAWLLLVITSLPVHFLANSLIGPSYIFEPPETVILNGTTIPKNYYSDVGFDQYIFSQASFVCWSAFRTGHARLPVSTELLQADSAVGDPKTGLAYSTIRIDYDMKNCTGLANSTNDLDALELPYASSSIQPQYGEGNCRLYGAVRCGLMGPKPAKCRLNVRMNAAFILTAGLIIKTIYMISVNLLARGHPKRQLLTFGDVIAASASNPEVRVQGECLVNARENVRRQNTHQCHKHCKSTDESKTGDEIGHCQKCKQHNSTNKLSNELQPTIATKIKKSFISVLGNMAVTQMGLMFFCSLALLGGSLAVAIPIGVSAQLNKQSCDRERELDLLHPSQFCQLSQQQQFAKLSGGWGGFNKSLPVTSLAPDKLGNEFLSFLISNGAQFIYSLLYLLLIYNITLVSQEQDWGKLEHKRKRLRCTIVKGECFEEDYLLQLPKKILIPIMVFSVLTHWMLGEALQTQETVWRDNDESAGRHVEHSMYVVTYAAYPLWIATGMVLLMTGVCWWAFTYRREGFIPQMYGSIRVLCAATTQLDDFPATGVQWGDMGQGKAFRHAGLSAEMIMKIVPHELYAGMGEEENQPLLWRGKKEGEEETE